MQEGEKKNALLKGNLFSLSVCWLKRDDNGSLVAHGAGLTASGAISSEVVVVLMSESTLYPLQCFPDRYLLFPTFSHFISRGLSPPRSGLSKDKVHQTLVTFTYYPE